MLPSPGFISDSVLEQKAIDLLREHERKRDTKISLPVPIVSIIEHTLGLRIVWVEIEELPDEIILARIDPDYLGYPTIQMNEARSDHFEQYFGTENFSLAHEVAHWVLHYGRGNGRQLGFTSTIFDRETQETLDRRMNDGDRRELQAERFAAFLLLPEYLTLAAARSCDLGSWSQIAAFSRKCGVSKRAMTRRLEALGLITLKNGQLVDPRDPGIVSSF